MRKPLSPFLLVATALASPISAQARDDLVSPREGMKVLTEVRARQSTVIFRVRGGAMVRLECGRTGVVSECEADTSHVRLASDTAVRVPVRYRATGVGSGTVLLIVRSETAADTGRIEVEVVPPGRLPAPTPVPEPFNGGAGSGPRTPVRIDPVVFVSPPVAYSSVPIDVEIEWCAGDQPLDAGSRRITYPRRVNVTAQFSYVTGFQECPQETKYSYGTVAPLSTYGVVLDASICDGAGRCASGSGTYFLAADRPTISLASNPSGNFDRSLCLTSGAGKAGAFQCGELLLAHAMPTYRSLDAERDLTLLYTSGTAHPYLLIAIDVRIPQGAEVPDSLRARLIIGGAEAATAGYTGSGFVPGGPPRRITLPFSATGRQTGIYEYTVTLDSYRSTWGANPRSTTATGRLVVVNRIQTPYGRGWSVAGTSALYPGQPGGSVLLVEGDASWRVYDPTGIPNRWRAAAGRYRDTLALGGLADPAGNTSRYWRRGLDGAVVFYDTVGNQKWLTEPSGRRVAFTHRNETLRESGLSSIRVPPYAQNLLYRFVYTAAGALDSIADPSGRRMAATITNGELTALADPLQDPAYTGIAPPTTRRVSSPGGTVYLRYGANGLLQTWLSPLGTDSTRYGYAGPTAALDSAVSVLGVRWDFLSDRLQGFGGAAPVDSAAVIARIDPPEAAAFTFWLNGFGAPVRARDPLNQNTYLSYDTVAQRVSQADYPNGRRVRMRYDGAGRLVAAEDVTHSAVVSLGRDSTRYVYPDTGNARHLPSRIVLPRAGAAGRDSLMFTYFPDGLPRTVQDTRGYTTTFAYTDAQLTSISGPVGDLTTLTYSSPLRNLETINVTSLVRPGGFSTTIRTDMAGRVRRIDAGDGASTFYYPNPLNWIELTLINDETAVWNASLNGFELSTRDLETSFVYDREGNLTKRTDPKFPSGSERSWVRDALGRVSTMTDEFGGQETWTYSGALLTLHRDRNLSWTQWKYDALGRDTATTSWGVNFPTFWRHIEYDALGNPTLIESEHGRTARTYTREGTTASETQTIKSTSATRTFSYTYWLNNTRRTATYPNGRQIEYRAGADNLVEAVRYTGAGGGVFVDSVRFLYDGLGRRDQLILRQAQIDYGFDHNGSLIRATGSPSNDYGFLATAFDAAGRLTGYQEGNPQMNAFFVGYNKRGFQTQDAGGSYWYDEAGNRVWMLALGDTTYYEFLLGTGARRSDRLARTVRRGTLPNQSRYFEYDATGALTKDYVYQSTQWQHVYDAAGHLRSHNPTDTVVQYQHDGLGRLIVRRQPNQSGVETGYDGMNVATHGAAEFIHDLGVDEPLIFLLAGNPCYFISSGGRQIDLVTANGSSNCAGGDQAAFSGAVANSRNFELARNPELTPSPSVALSYFRNRWYDSRTGRFTQEDPIGYAGGTNLYAYAGSSPATFTDPFGLCEPFCSALDAALLAADINDIRANGPSLGNVTGVLLGSISTALPGVTGGGAVDDLARSAGRAVSSAFSRWSFRRGLARATSGAVRGADAHHIFPVKFAPDFERIGIDINNPQFGAWWERSSHRRNAAAYNRQWEDFLATNPSADKAMEFGRNLARSIGLDVRF